MDPGEVCVWAIQGVRGVNSQWSRWHSGRPQNSMLMMTLWTSLSRWCWTTTSWRRRQCTARRTLSPSRRRWRSGKTNWSQCRHFSFYNSAFLALIPTDKDGEFRTYWMLGCDVKSRGSISSPSSTARTSWSRCLWKGGSSTRWIGRFLFHWLPMSAGWQDLEKHHGKDCVGHPSTPGYKSTQYAGEGPSHQI